ncbi:transporter [Streptomyces sp. SID6673]|nr:transporter [Streptomyces sp. SID11726]NEB24284.1 transporter [Streptomyces sp. SID6673]
MSGFEVVVVLIVVLVWLGLIALVLRGWRNRGRRQADLIGDLPAVPAGLPAPTRGPDTGLYVGSTIAPSWQDRVAVGDIGDRAAAEISGYPEGILIDRKGASAIWIPRPSITAVRTERGLAGKVMTADGVLVIRWVLPSGTEIDSGLRADDKTIYPGWIADHESATAAPNGTAAPGDDSEQRKDQ